MIQWQPRKSTLWRRVESAFAWAVWMIALGLAVQVARAAFHVMTGAA